MSKSLKRILGSLLAVTMLVSAVTIADISPVKVQNVEAASTAGVTIYECEGAQETAYIEWAAVKDTDHYYVSYAKDGSSNFTQIDDDLIRQYPDRWRADILGLSAGNYTIKVECKDKNSAVIAEGTKTCSVAAQDRTGFAFSPASSNYSGGAIGAYNADGTLKSDAIVLYITEKNFDTITLTVKNKDNKDYTAKGLADILKTVAHKSSKNPPLDVRFLGTISENHEGLVSPKILETKTEDDYIDCNLTLEGVGEDTIFDGLGLRYNGVANSEIRNIAFYNWHDDAIQIQGGGNANLWIHNNDLFYGTNKGGDQEKGDGSTDIKDDSRYSTFSYNHYWDSGKSSLCGMKSESGENFISYDHNWFDHSDSRHPRVRTMSVWVYNNYFDGNAKYGPGASLKSNLFVENNYFRNTKYPMLQGSMGHDSDGKGGSNTFDDNPGAGKIKAYNNTIIGGQFTADGAGVVNGTYGGDAYVVKTRTEQVPSSYNIAGTTYNNFDTQGTQSAYIQSVTPDTPEAARDKVTKYAGRVGDHFTYAFTAADDTDDKRSAAMDAAVSKYFTDKSDDFISNGGASDGSGPVPPIKPETPTTTTTEAVPETSTDAPVSSKPVDAAPAENNSGEENGKISVTYDNATDKWTLTDTSSSLAAKLNIPLKESIKSGKVVIRGTVNPIAPKAAGSWALISITGPKAQDGTYPEIAAFASNGSKELTLRIDEDKNNGFSENTIKFDPNKEYSYEFIIDVDAKSVTLTVDGTKFEGIKPFTKAAEVGGWATITASSATDRGIVASTPYFGIVTDEPVKPPVTDPTQPPVTDPDTQPTTLETDVYGDADADEKVEINDVPVLLDYVLKGVGNMTDTFKEKIDLDQNGKINSADVAILLQHILDSSYQIPLRKSN